MAKKYVTSKTNAPAAAKSVSPVRNSAIPKKAPVPAGARPAITHEMIAMRAYCISCSGTGGSEMDNWLRAEAELRTELGA